VGKLAMSFKDLKVDETSIVLSSFLPSLLPTQCFLEHLMQNPCCIIRSKLSIVLQFPPTSCIHGFPKFSQFRGLFFWWFVWWIWCYELHVFKHMTNWFLPPFSFNQALIIPPSFCLQQSNKFCSLFDDQCFFFHLKKKGMCYGF
jgi:hypothetical protein